MSDRMPPCIPDRNSDRMSKLTLDKMLESMPGKMAELMPDSMYRMTQLTRKVRMSERMTGRTAEFMPDKMSKVMSDKLNLYQTKWQVECQN